MNAVCSALTTERCALLLPRFRSLPLSLSPLPPSYAATTSGRTARIEHPESVVGLVLNTLPVRIDVAEVGGGGAHSDGAATFADLLDAVHAQLMASLEFESCPLVEIQRNCLPRTLPPASEAGDESLFPVVLDFEASLFYLPFHFVRILLTIRLAPPHIFLLKTFSSLQPEMEAIVLLGADAAAAAPAGTAAAAAAAAAVDATAAAPPTLATPATVDRIGFSLSLRTTHIIRGKHHILDIMGTSENLSFDAGFLVRLLDTVGALLERVAVSEAKGGGSRSSSYVLQRWRARGRTPRRS